MKVKDLALISMFAAILFVQEEVLSFLPNIQLTFFLIVLYSRLLGNKKTILIIVIHVLLDNLFVGSFLIYIIAPQLFSYIIIPITLNTIFKKVENPVILGLIGMAYALIYSFSFMITNVLVLNINIAAYFIADIPFEIILCLSTFITILWLYKPLMERLSLILYKNE